MKNVGINVGLKIKLNSTEKKIVGMIIENENYAAEQMAVYLNVNVRTVERNMSSLQKKGVVQRVGTKKTGKWIVVQSV